MDKYSLSPILKIITPGDKILIILIVALAAFSFIAINNLKQPGEIVIIEVAGLVVQQLNMDKPQEITVTGSIGNTTVKIDQKSVQVIHSDCPEKICIKTGKIRHIGEIIVCVPNRVVIRINGKQKNHFDVITQ